jgi:hypothetical protein
VKLPKIGKKGLGSNGLKENRIRKIGSAMCQPKVQTIVVLSKARTIYMWKIEIFLYMRSVYQKGTNLTIFNSGLPAV